MGRVCSAVTVGEGGIQVHLIPLWHSGSHSSHWNGSAVLSLSAEREQASPQSIPSSNGHAKINSVGTRCLRNPPGSPASGEMRRFSTLLQTYCSLSEAGVLAKLVSKHPPSYSKTITERFRNHCSICWRAWGAMITHSIRTKEQLLQGGVLAVMGCVGCWPDLMS